MSFDIRNKVALVTGGAAGLGLNYVKELLRNDLKGVTIADINCEFGKSALEEIRKEFGPNKAIFVKTDVTNKKQFDDAFKKTISTFTNVDILINNAGILNDAVWEKSISINLVGTVYGTLLGMEEYIPKYKSGNEGVIVNISSIAGLDPFPITPLYSATKFAVQGLSRALGDKCHYERTKVKIVTLCPGVTETNLITDISGQILGPPYQQLLELHLGKLPMQKAEFVSQQLINVIEKSESGSVWIIEGGEEAYHVHIPGRCELVKSK